MTAGPVCFCLPRLLPGVGAYFDLVGTGKRLIYADHVRHMVWDHTRIERGKHVAC
jgi:hypothetical protein